MGWKGLINDPHLDGTYDIELGLKKARSLLLGLTSLGLPAATESTSTSTWAMTAPPRSSQIACHPPMGMPRLTSKC